MPVVDQRPGAIANRSVISSDISSEKRISTARVIASPAENEDKVCWVEMKPCPYQRDHQVELLHLQAEADALLIKLQAKEQRQLNARAASKPLT
jgi:hypothetical protein